jgi:hypothetical protein
MLLGVITALILALPLAAQTTYDSVGSLSSNTKTATASIFSTDVDNFINYHKFSSVKFDKGFVFITGRPSSSSSPAVLDLGYAGGSEKMYFGAWYRGNIFRLTGGDETHTITPTYDTDSMLLTQTEEKTEYNAKWNESTNQIEFLIGVGGQGIKLGFFESFSSNQNTGSPDRVQKITNHQNGRIDYVNATDEYGVSKGRMKPYLGWGTNLAVGEANLMPYLDVSLAIDSDSKVDNYRNYTTISGTTQNATTSVGAGKDDGRLYPEGTVGFKLDLAKKETTQVTLELKYGIGLSLPDSSYDATGLGSDSVKGSVEWNDGYVNRVTKYIDRTVTETNLEVGVWEYTDIKHTVTPIYKIVGEPADGFRVGFSAQVPVTISEYTGHWYNDNYKITKTKFNAGDLENDRTGTIVEHWSGGQNVYSTIAAQLNLSLGASYKLIPNRFTVNAGISAKPVDYSHVVITESPDGQIWKKTEKETDGYGNVLKNGVYVSKNNDPDKVTINDTWSPYTATLRGGFAFYFSPEAALDMLIASSVADTFKLNVTEVNVLFSIKF